ncbi:acyl-homoserine-lactone synthase [Pandoraea sp. NPDC087047]|uniref:acyl-homoserine-lactone synthase n=1 Tax=Pandoraea sp. NPDC087047 TaxID=3364390 RepID=UPI00381D844F
MRVDIVRGAQMMPSARAELTHFRHRIFVQKLGWHMSDSPGGATHREGEETDEYDQDDTVYVTLRGDADAIVGCARLLPATRRYLLVDHFRHLVDDLPAAVGRDEDWASPETGIVITGESAERGAVGPVWELSRFAWESAGTKAPGQHRQEGQCDGARELLRAAVFAARALGAKRLIGVTYVSLARLFRRLGVQTHQLGTALRLEGRWVAAYRIDIDTVTLAALNLA